MRNLLIAGNWKMNKTPEESVALVNGIIDGMPELNGVEVAVCPPFTSLSSVIDVTSGKNIAVSAQNLYIEAKGAYTGEVSGRMIKAIGCKYVIIGHSERRQYFGETDITVRKKIIRAQEEGLIPIFCLGEKLEDRERGSTKAVIEIQVRTGMEKVYIPDPQYFVIAYEPVWAIGTGVTATPDEAQDVHGFLRELLTEKYGEKIGAEIKLLYGGSVTPENAKNLLGKPDIDGALVGGASLTPKNFLGIINQAVEVKK